MFDLVKKHADLKKFNDHVELIKHDKAFRKYIETSIALGMSLKPIDKPAYDFLLQCEERERLGREQREKKLNASQATQD